MKLKVTFSKIIIFGLILILFVPACTSTTANNTTLVNSESIPLPSLEGKKVLMVWGGWKGHQPKLFVDIVSKLLKSEGAEVVISDSLEVYANENLLMSMDLIVQSVTMDKVKNKHIETLAKAVKSGVGFAGAHGGFCDAFRENTLYQYMTGGQFVAHPGGQINYEVRITDKEDAVVKGINTFSTKTEQYYLHYDPNIKILATTTFTGKHDSWIEGVVMPVAWKKYFAKGRIFCTTLGHHPEEFNEQPAQDMLMNGLRWASASKYLPKESF